MPAGYQLDNFLAGMGAPWMMRPDTFEVHLMTPPR